MTSRCLLLLETCKNINQLKRAHALLITCGLDQNSYALSRILSFCSDPFHGSLSHAHKIFKHIENPTICICNTMIKTFLHKDENFSAIEMYKLILRNGLCPDSYTLPYVLKACANIKSLNLGGSVHAHGVRLGFSCGNFVGNTLIAMYSAVDEMGAAKCVFDEISWPCVVSWTVLISGNAKKGDVYSARLVFDEAPVKDRGIWGAMISGYVQNNCFKEGLKLFRLMQLGGVKPDEGVFVSVLSACAHLGSLEIGIWIHGYVEKIKMPIGLQLGTALIDMYAKCGNMTMGKGVFDKMPQRDVVCWNAMIAGYGTNGDGETAVFLFDEMQKAGIRPDDVTFISLLTACSYSDMAHEGLNLLNVMRNVYKMEPKSEHYGCIIDLLGRARLVAEAKDIIQTMPVSSSTTEEGIAWRALLSACCENGDVDMAENVAERVALLERHSGAYVLLSNLYAAAGRHGEARRIRKVMVSRGVEKTPGCSAVEINGIVHEFIAGEKSHSQMEEIFEVLKVIKMQFDYSLGSQNFVPEHAGVT